MDIVTAFKYRECGYRIRRNGWAPLHYVEPTTMQYTKLSTKDVLANDWEIITENVKTHLNKNGSVDYSD